MAENDQATIEVRELKLAYGSYVVMEDITFDVPKGEIFTIMGGSGSGKSTLLKGMIGLIEPREGEVLYDGQSFTGAAQEKRVPILRRMGILYQNSALFSSMTLGENVAFPLEEFTDLNERDILEIVRFKLTLVGLDGTENLYPSQLSGGMRKRAALARAIALDPDYLFFDEPSAGLDPITSKRLDDLILRLRDSIGSTVIIVTHELPQIFAIADRGIFLDAETKRPAAIGNPKELCDDPPNEVVRRFLTREKTFSNAVAEG